jgi:hypothetical protein
VRHRIEVYTKGAGGIGHVGLGGNDSVANKRCEVSSGIIDYGVQVFYHLEEFARGLGLTTAECTRNLRNKADVFRAKAKTYRPSEGIIGNVTKIIHCVDRLEEFVGDQDLTSEVDGYARPKG